MNINNITSQISNMPKVGADQNKIVGETSSFKDVLFKFTEDANKTDYDDKISNLSVLLGDAENTHQAMIAAEKADLALRLTIQIRNKIIDAYTEVMRMQI
ncbi:MAG: flagellar hook-basal body complex protein FliE [Firmicutes bacterium]|nr:flagellar hook-basal body complex protein FliE [Bacillota bacterium]